jgi:hypothetical protein
LCRLKIDTVLRPVELVLRLIPFNLHVFTVSYI